MKKLTISVYYCNFAVANRRQECFRYRQRHTIKKIKIMGLLASLKGLFKHPVVVTTQPTTPPRTGAYHTAAPAAHTPSTPEQNRPTNPSTPATPKQVYPTKPSVPDTPKQERPTPPNTSPQTAISTQRPIPATPAPRAHA